MMQNPIAIIPDSMKESRYVDGVGRHRFELTAAGRNVDGNFSYRETTVYSQVGRRDDSSSTFACVEL